MPHLAICGRALPLGSDDFTFCWNCPTYFYHVIWLGLLLGAWYPFHSPATNKIWTAAKPPSQLLTDQKLCVSQARVWLTASLSLFATSFAVAIATNMASARGTIFMDPVGKIIRDCWVRICVIVQALLGFVEFGWGLAGVIVYGVSLQEADGAGHACLRLTPGGCSLLLSACIFVLARRFLSLLFCCGCVLSKSEQINHRWRDPSTGKPMHPKYAAGSGFSSSSLDKSEQSRTQSLLDGELKMEEEEHDNHRAKRDQSFARCCRSLCCCVSGRSEDASESAVFDDVGRLLSEWFADFDVVPTDLAAMLYAVHVEQDRKRRREERRWSEEKVGGVEEAVVVGENGRGEGRGEGREEGWEEGEVKGELSGGSRGGGRRRLLSQQHRKRYKHESEERLCYGDDPNDQLLLCQIVDNVRFAYGIFGWMLHSYDGMSTCSGCRLLCCGAWCCHCCTENVHTRREVS